LGARVGVGEMRAQVAQPRRPEQRVRQRVTDHVAVGVTLQARLAVEQLTPQVQATRAGSTVQVEAESEPEVRHPGEGYPSELAGGHQRLGSAQVRLARDLEVHL